MMTQACELSPMGSRYQVVRMLGQGCYSDVWEAIDRKAISRVALKVIRVQTQPSASLTAFRERFLKEARCLQRIKHPGVVEIFDYGVREDGAPYLVMELLEGETLADFLRKKQRLPLRTVLEIARQIASTLETLHSNEIIHRDLTPSNLMVLPHPDVEQQVRVKLLDFGLARLGSREAVARTDPSGTLSCGAPERCDVETSVRLSDRSDQFALASLVFEMLSGRPSSNSDRWFDPALMESVTDGPPPWDSLPPPEAKTLAWLLNRMLSSNPRVCPRAHETEVMPGRLRDHPLLCVGSVAWEEVADGNLRASQEAARNASCPRLLSAEAPLPQDEAAPAPLADSCDSIEEFISRALDNDLTPDQQERLRVHVASCSACAATAKRMTAAVQRLRKFGRVLRPPPFLSARIVERLERASLIIPEKRAGSRPDTRRRSDRTRLH